MCSPSFKMEGFSILGVFAALSVSSVACFSSVGGLGVVSNITRCGGYGTPVELRVSGCEGRCQLVPATRYDIQYDIIPSTSTPSLSLSVDLIFLGTSFRLFDTELANSSVQPGIMYTVLFTIVPNDVLAKQTVLLRAIIYHTDNRLLEICINTEVDILEMP